MHKMKSPLTSIISLLLLMLSINVYAGSKNSGVGSQPLSAAETESLLFMREEEKMARDVYLTLYDLWDDEVFENIADSEQEHMDAMALLLEKYDLLDPAIDGIGLFSDPALQELYDELVARGEKSRMEALYVGALIEEMDMRDIQEAIDAAEHADIIRVYENLLKGSRNHLRAFVGKIEDEGLVYEAQVLTQDEVDEIVDSPIERGGL
ncbi:DUF2202 domain-containing protein [Methylomarinum sp. Ch1-1]|uniref:DUF2202 domain-containing protein n=1 Tax=Methylomarinum roseum TaxID=3067653 RepID=A0AAU7NTL7_9GAMM